MNRHTKPPRVAPAPRLPPVYLFANPLDGEIEILVIGTNGTFNLALSADGPSLSIRDVERGSNKFKAALTLQANGHLRGWFVEKKGATGAQDTLAWIPARKPRPKRRKPAPRKEG